MATYRTAAAGGDPGARVEQPLRRHRDRTVDRVRRLRRLHRRFRPLLSLKGGDRLGNLETRSALVCGFRL